MEDLVALDVGGVAHRRRHRAQDAPLAAGEIAHDAHDVLERPARPVRQVGRRLRDLGHRRRHQESEHLGGEPFALRSKLRQHLAEVAGDDPLGAAELFEGRQRQAALAALHGGRPQPLHHQLQERRLHAVAAGVRGSRGGRARLTQRQPPGSHLVEHRVDQRRLDRHGLLVLRQPERVLLDRAFDRSPSGRAVEVVDAQVVAEQARDRRLELVKPGERVLAQRDQDVNVQADGVDDLRERRREAVGAVLVRVIEEVLLELVEDEQRGAHVHRPLAHGGDQRLLAAPRRQLGSGRRLDRPAQRLGQLQHRVRAPLPDDRDRERRPVVQPRPRPLSQPRHDAGEQQRALADAACPVEEGQPRTAQVGGDQARVAFAPEEEIAVALAVGHEAHVRAAWERRSPRRRRLRHCHRAAPTRSGPRHGQPGLGTPGMASPRSWRRTR